MILFQDLRGVDPAALVVTVSHLAENLRPSDLDEIAAVSDLEPFVALMEAVAVSDRVWTIVSDETPIAVFGCAPAGDGTGYVWMVGTPAMDQPSNAIGILRATRPYLAEMHQVYSCLWNNIDARNVRSIRWLQWAGFSIIDAHPRFGRQGLPFLTFARIEPCVSQQ